jgi:acetolactate synthase-1/2/3 large subunit
MEYRGIAPVGVKPTAPDFTAVARAYGMATERIDGIDGLGAALERARAAAAPYLIDMAMP